MIKWQDTGEEEHKTIGEVLNAMTDSSSVLKASDLINIDNLLQV